MGVTTAIGPTEFDVGTVAAPGAGHARATATVQADDVTGFTHVVVAGTVVAADLRLVFIAATLTRPATGATALHTGGGTLLDELPGELVVTELLDIAIAAIAVGGAAPFRDAV